MGYADFTREQLLDHINEVELKLAQTHAKMDALLLLNRQLLREKEQEAALDFAWSGNLGHWYWDIRSNHVTFNPLKVITLGYDVSDIPEEVPFQFFTNLLHPDDYQTTMNAMKAHLNGEAPVYEVEYRIKAKDGSYHWYYDRGKITDIDANGNPVFLAGIVFDVTDKKRKVQELEAQNQLLAEEAMLDGLTKIRNRRALVEVLQHAIDDLKTKNGSTLSIALFDIDDFKRINDTKGHIFGDKVLTELAEISIRSIREPDVFGRYGGEEFLLVLPNTDKESAFLIADRIRKLVSEQCFYGDIHVTVSAGISEYLGGSISDFIKNADENLYIAKRTGKNKVV